MSITATIISNKLGNEQIKLSNQDGDINAREHLKNRQKRIEELNIEYEKLKKEPQEERDAILALNLPPLEENKEIEKESFISKITNFLTK